MNGNRPPDRQLLTRTEGEGETLDMPEGLGLGTRIVKRVFRISDFGFRISARPPGTPRSICHPERGRPTAESKDPPTSPENVTELGSLSRLLSARGRRDAASQAGGQWAGLHPPFLPGRWPLSASVAGLRGSLDSLRSLGMTVNRVQAGRLHHKGLDSIVVRASRPHIMCVGISTRDD